MSLNVCMSLYVQASTLLHFRCSEKGARNGHDMRAERTDRACNEHGPLAGAEGGGLNGSTSSERYYGVIVVKHSEAHLTE